MWLFDSDCFMPRSHCGPGWTENLILINQFANFLIFLSYFSIPFSLFYLWAKRRADFPRSYLLIVFAAFIFFCGLTHFNDVVAFTNPIYRFFTLVDFLTSMFSLTTAILLPYSVNYFVHLPSFQRLHALTNQLQSEVLKNNLLTAEYIHHNTNLKMKVKELEHELMSGRRLQENMVKINELKSMLNNP